VTADPKKAARAALYVARKTFADGGANDDIPNIQNLTSVFPKPQRMWDTPMPGGAYLSMPSKEDITGHKAAQASVGVRPGGKPFFNVSRDAVEQTGSPGRGSAMVKTNLFKQKAGWQWKNAPEGHEDTNTLVSVEHRGQHHYALEAHFPKGVDLARYAEASSEPRLRPTTQGNVFFGPQVGNILVRGREHPVYKHIIAKATGGATDDAFTAYHGTPHEFEPEPDAPYGRFRDTAIGSGEGAQAYGYGHYLAGNERIAQSYKNNVFAKPDPAKFTSASAREIAEHQLQGFGSQPDALALGIDDLEKSLHNARFKFSIFKDKMAAKRVSDLEEAVTYLKTQVKPGFMYQARVTAKPEHFLDWDKPLSEQSHVLDRIDHHIGDPEIVMQRLFGDPSKATGKDLHDALGGNHKPKEVAEKLRQMGIPGIRYLDASSRGPTGAPTHNYVVFDPKNIDIVKRYAQGGEVYSNHAPRHTMQSPAVAELKHLLTTHRDELRRMKGKTQYAAIDAIMKRISREHGIAPSKLHDDWVSVYHQTPDAWVAGDHGNVVDRALKMTSRGGYAFGGAPAGFAAATGAPINFAPASGAFTGLPLPKGPDIAPSKATLAAILASRPTTHTGSGEPVKLSSYVPPPPGPTFNASLYNLPKDEASEGVQGGSGDRWHPDMGGATAGGASLGGGGPSSEVAARGGRIHRADGGEAGYKETPFQHIEKRSPGWGASWTPLHEVSQKLGGIKKISESASNYGDFMNVMAHKAKNDQLSPRDLIKSYLMTVSSQGRQAVNPQTILKNWPDYPGPIHDKIRPEGAMGEWLLSPIGKRYLDAAEQGIVDHGAISHALKSFGGFGKINNAEGKALPWAAQSLVPHTKIVSNMIAASLEGRHSAEDWRNWVKNNIHGVGFAKSGFWGSMLGRGDQSVPDARQLVLHTPNKNDEATSLIGVGEGVPASQREGEAMQRIIDRQNALGLSIPKELSPHYQALAHHTIWDAAGGTDTTHQDVINAMKHAASGGAIDGDNEHPVAMIFKALGMPGLERSDEQTTHSVVDHALSLTRHTALHGMQPKRGRP